MRKSNLNIISSDDQIKNFFGSAPLIAASVRVTKSCNLRCQHCYANGGRALEGELTTKQLKKVINDLSELGALHIFYTGGEPFIRSDIIDILKYTDEKGLGILISTNGQLVTERILKKLKDLNIKLFQISIDGNQSTHSKIRGNGTFLKATELIKSAKKILKKNVGVGSVMMTYNWKEIGDILQLASDKGADIFSLMLLITSGRASADLNPSSKQILKSIQRLFNSYEKNLNKIKFANNTTLPAALVPKKWRDKGLHQTFALCSFPYCIGIESNGDVAPCDGFFNSPEMILGNIKEKSIKEIWRDSKVLKDIMKINPKDLKGVCSKCIYKEYCAGGCRASAYNVYKDLTMPDPICQKLYEEGLFPKSCLTK